MSRYHRDKQIAGKRYKEYIDIQKEHSLLLGGQKKVKLAFVNQRGRFKKRDIYDCGKSKCSICHGGRKYPKRTRTQKEILSLHGFKEQVQELEFRS